MNDKAEMSDENNDIEIKEREIDNNSANHNNNLPNVNLYFSNAYFYVSFITTLSRMKMMKLQLF